MFADTPYTLPVIAALIGLFFVGGFVKGAASFGQPMVTTSIGVLFLPVPSAVAIAIIPAFSANIIQAWSGRGALPFLRPYLPFFVLLVVGIIAGLNVFVALDQSSLQAVIGALLVTFVVTQLFGFIPPFSPPPSRGVLAATGLISGLAAGTTSFVGFPALPVLIAYRLDRTLFALVTSVMFFITMGLIGGGLTLFGFFGRAELLMGLICCIPSILGQQAGLSVRNRLSVERLRLVINVILGITGVVLVLRGVGLATR